MGTIINIDAHKSENKILVFGKEYDIEVPSGVVFEVIDKAVTIQKTIEKLNNPSDFDIKDLESIIDIALIPLNIQDNKITRERLKKELTLPQLILLIQTFFSNAIGQFVKITGENPLEKSKNKPNTSKKK